MSYDKMSTVQLRMRSSLSSISHQDHVMTPQPIVGDHYQSCKQDLFTFQYSPSSISMCALISEAAPLFLSQDV